MAADNDDAITAAREFVGGGMSSDIRKAQKILLSIWAAWYPGANWEPADNMTDLLHQIGNSLLNLPEYQRANDSRLAAQAAMDRAFSADRWGPQG